MSRENDVMTWLEKRILRIVYVLYNTTHILLWWYDAKKEGKKERRMGRDQMG